MNGGGTPMLWAIAVRLASVAAGILILKHEVYDAEQAEIVVVALGLWLIGVPPALWLDAFRRAGKTLEALESDVQPPRPGSDRDDAQPPRPDTKDSDGRTE